MTPELNQWEHMGDGLYVAFDGYGLQLRVNDHRSEPTFYLEPQVFRSLSNFAERIWERKP